MESAYDTKVALPESRPLSSRSHAPLPDGTPGVVLNDEWYLRAYSASDPGDANLRQRTLHYLALRAWDWKRITFAATVGLCLGLGLAASTGAYRTPAVVQVQHSPAPIAKTVAHRPLAIPSSGQDSSRPAITAFTANPAATHLNSEEMARLKARNRRLEALIAVLRQRSTEEKRPAPEQTTYLGQ